MKSEAIKYYEKANSLQGNVVENYANLGMAYDKVGQADNALGAYKKALSMNPKHSGALTRIGIQYANKGDLEQAEKYFKTVLKYYPDDQSAKDNLNRVLGLRRK